MEHTATSQLHEPVARKAHLALASAASIASRFMPLPLIDDVLRERALRHVVRRTLAGRGLDYEVETVSPLFRKERSGRIASGAVAVLGWVALFPIRRLMRIAGAVRGTPRDTARPVLLGRAVARALDLGMLGAGTPAAERFTEARRVRDAFDGAFGTIGGDMLGAALGDLTRGRLAAPPRLRGLLEIFDEELDQQLISGDRQVEIASI